MKSTPNFEGFVLGCIDSYDSNQILIFSGFSRSTRFAFFCTAQISKFQQKTVQIFAGMKMKFQFSFAFFDEICDFLRKFDDNFPEFHRNLQEMTKCLEILRKSVRKFWKMLEISRICEKFSIFVSFFHSSPQFIHPLKFFNSLLNPWFHRRSTLTGGTRRIRREASSGFLT